MLTQEWDVRGLSPPLPPAPHISFCQKKIVLLPVRRRRPSTMRGLSGANRVPGVASHRYCGALEAGA